MTAPGHKLEKYYRTVQIVGAVAIVITGVFTYFFPTYFLFLGPTNTTLALLLSVFMVHVTCLVLHEMLNRKIFFTISRYYWVVFFYGIIIASGGIESDVKYFFIFPVLAAACDLHRKDVLYISRVIGVFLLSLFFINGDAGLDSAMQHAFETFILFLMFYMISRLVYEKEVIHEAFDRLTNIEQVKTDFITISSNLLRNPLTGALYAFTELSEEGTSENDRKNIVKGGMEKTKDALRILNDLINTIEIDSEHFKFITEKINMKDVLHHIVNELSVLAQYKKVHVSLTTPEDVWVAVDAKIIKLAIDNVIDNAVRYSPLGEVEIVLQKAGDACEITISDNGIGIEEKDAPFIFERMYRGMNAVHLESNRNGIGMHTTKRIIELHKGTIQLVPKEEKGTTVRIVLPVV